ncbi:AAA family ATPase [Micromonospora sp. NPDC050980]|uniref:AAA family ATPase n=1 Tax=Micromonospora sp. NPDC050980 TaxID=3155161 RepID=UPI0033EB0379
MRIVWLNGAFGAGKTTLAKRLLADDARLLLFDAELPGYMLREIVPLPPSGDFQDLRIWRRSVADTAVALLQEYHTTLVVPMTVVVPQYLDEIFLALRAAGASVDHFFLNTPVEVLRQRIEEQSIWPGDQGRDAEVRAWRLAQIQRCVAAVPQLSAQTMLLDGELSVDELAGRVRARLAEPAT